ncbi:hypothetical protein BDV93DRAFT_511825 [Ceratobasidium sp. AG-I]|nr:hypothetical protein BDV93DRAFT_511825 [Ceratobasidium sp. AG-I]
MSSSNQTVASPYPALLHDLSNQLGTLIENQKWIGRSQETRRKELIHPRDPWGRIDFSSPKHWVNSQFPTKEARFASNLFVLDKLEENWRRLDTIEVKILDWELAQGGVLSRMGLGLMKQTNEAANELAITPAPVAQGTIYVNLLCDLQKISEFTGLYNKFTRTALENCLRQIEDHRARQAGKKDDLFFRFITVPKQFRKRSLVAEMIWIDDQIKNDHEGRAYLGMLENEGTMILQAFNACEEMAKKVGAIKALVGPELVGLREKEEARALEEEMEEAEDDEGVAYYPSDDEQMRRIKAWLKFKDDVRGEFAEVEEQEGLSKLMSLEAAAVVTVADCNAAPTRLCA